MTSPNPIHWECYVTKPGKPEGTATVVDLRTLPEDVKVSIIQAALNVGFRFNNGEYENMKEGSAEEDALVDLVVSVEAVREHMHSVNLVPCP